MHFQITRNGQVYGPYTLDDLQRYVASGNVLLTDLTKSEEMTEWLPVSQVLMAAPAPVPAQYQQVPPAAQDYAQPAPIANPALAASTYPDAPNLHWGLTILFSVLSCFLFFTFIWDIVIALWLRRVQPSDRSLFWYLGALGVYAVKYVLSLLFLGTVIHHSDTTNLYTSQLLGFTTLSSVLRLLELGLIVTGNFVKRSSLLEHFNGPEPVGLALDPVMTFFFAPWYFQYHLNRINAIKQAARNGTQPVFG